MTFLTLAGSGDPNNDPFGEQIQALYMLSYALRMLLKQQGDEYTVYPLEGIWTTSDNSRGATLNKAALTYEIMIRQPDSVDDGLFAEALTATLAKKTNPYLSAVRRVRYTDGMAVQAIHTGPFETEGTTFALMQTYLATQHLHQAPIMPPYQHREIYLSDFRRVAPEKRKTLLRYRIH